MIGTDIDLARAFLNAGKLVAIPTETVYGLAANGLDPTAIAGIFEAKKRPHFDPLILHSYSIEQAFYYAKEWPDAAQALAETFWPGPLTLVLPKKDIVPDIATSGLASVGLRVPNHPLSLSLLATLPFPLAAPSANPFGYVSPTTAQHVADNLAGKVAYILDGGPCKVGLESSIVGFDKGKAVLLRKGGISIDSLEKVVGKLKVQDHSNSRPQAPGSLSKHYAPKVKVQAGERQYLLNTYFGEDFIFVAFKDYASSLPKKQQIILSEEGDLAVAASKLFSVFRAVEGLRPAMLLIEWMPETGIGIAMNDRIRRASAGS